VKLAVDDLVVYGNHGIGRVADRRTQEVLGESQEVVVIELDQLTVTLPVALASTQLRPLVSKAELHRVGVALQDDSELKADTWLVRRREALEKLIGGTPVELAEIVREGAQRERLRSASGKGQSSLSERQIYTRARTLLCDEVAAALGIQPTAAEGWVDGHLTRPS
jgi:RNA polymerase-interacting CarD/CdnL/TRCF family regulator